MTTLTDTTSLDTLGLMNLDVVLEEIFGVRPKFLFPNDTRPTTVAALAAHAGASAKVIIGRLEEIMQLQHDIEISCEDLNALVESGIRPVLLDVREPWEYETCHLKDSILLATMNFPEVLSGITEAPHVYTICHHGVRSYSAAMYLRQKGVQNVRSLAGGVDRWAQVIDTDMARY